MQSPHPVDQLVPGAQIEVVGVAEDDLCLCFDEIVLVEGLDSGLGADRHKGRRFDLAVRGVQHAGSGTSLGVLGD